MTSRCDVTARQRAEQNRSGCITVSFVAPLIRGADVAARRPYLGWDPRKKETACQPLQRTYSGRMNVTGIGLAVLIVWLGSATRSSSQSTQAERQQFAATKAEADKGDALAQFTLGNYYAFGTGVSRDLVKAPKWHRKAAEQGLAQAQLRLAYEYVNGIGLKTDPIEAVKWLRRAAEHGSTEAQFELGRSYAEGQGVGENPVQAATWYRKAAEQNYPPPSMLSAPVTSRATALPRTFRRAWIGPGKPPNKATRPLRIVMASVSRKGKVSRKIISRRTNGSTFPRRKAANTTTKPGLIFPWR